MQTSRFKIFMFMLLGASSLAAQKQLEGWVATDKSDMLIGAIVQWEGRTDGVLTDEEGHFVIARPDTAANLVVRYVGYQPATVRITPDEDGVMIQIEGITELKQVEVRAAGTDNFVSSLNPHNVESISSNELKKAPCCNLSEAFETNGSVDISYTDAVTGAKEVQMLGLRGIYTQLTVENRPSLQGLATPYALEFIPGTWLESIQINKGSGSVVNGYQSIAGQINSEIVKPYKDKKVFVNLYGELTQRMEANVHLNKKINDKWSTGVLLHGNYLQNPIDNDGDRFYDLPLKKQLNGLYRLFYEGEQVCAQWNFQAITERRQSGQIEATAGLPWRVNQQGTRYELWSKVGYKGFSKAARQLGSQWGALYHRNIISLGQTPYDGTQRSLYANLLYSDIFGTQLSHKLTAGTSFQYDDYQEFLGENNIGRTEIVPGVFGEYTYEHVRRHKGDNHQKEEAEGESCAINQEKDWVIVAGLRADFHNLAGTIITPRLNVRYRFENPDLTLRAAIGRGYRMSNIFADNISLFASNRILEVDGPLKIEDAWNTGLNGIYKFKVFGREGSVNVDLYRTWFNNQVILDLDTDPSKIMVYNLDGRSYSNSLMTMFQYEVLKGLEVKLAYKTNDVRTTYRNAGLRALPLIPRQRGLVALSYETPNEKWRINASSQIVGPQRLADLPADLPQEYHAHQIHGETPVYALVNAQLTRVIAKHFEVYAGGENLTNYRQDHAILAYDNPFGQFFDATRIYAPMMGRRIYIGLRWGLE